MLDPTAEAAFRLSFAAGVFALMAVWEVWAPRRPRHLPRRLRWTSNLGIVLLDTLLLRLTVPAAAMAMALLAEERQWGLFNVWSAPLWVVWPVSLVALDLLTWGQHVLFHRVPVLWRFHRMHHADLEFDVSTGLRFHPGEIVVSLALRAALVTALGIPVGAVLVFEVLLNATSQFNHGNVRLPPALDRTLRRLVVTPDMHRVHHSSRRDETNSNFGFNLSCWDRLFRTYRDQPRDGHLGMQVGLDRFRSRRDLRLDRMLIQPWLGSGDGYPGYGRSA